MNQEIKTKWVEALESGEYLQTESYLKDVFGFCCLGVLCDLYLKAAGKGWDYLDIDIDGEVLPPEVMAWAGVDSNDPAVKVDEYEESITINLSELNDGGMEFQAIATLIREQL